MVLTEFQRDVCRPLAKHRVASGESYLAGAATLNELLAAPRASRDIDPFHDTSEALESERVTFHEGSIRGTLPTPVAPAG